MRFALVLMAVWGTSPPSMVQVPMDNEAACLVAARQWSRGPQSAFCINTITGKTSK